MEPFDLENPEPEPWQFTNEIHRSNNTLATMCAVLTKLQLKSPQSYRDFVETFRLCQ